MFLTFINKKVNAGLILNILLVIFFCFISEFSFSGTTHVTVKLSPQKKTSLILGGKKTIAAQVIGTKNKGITWSLEGEGTIKELSPSKILYSAPESFTIPSGAVITATSTEDTSASRSIKIFFKNIPFLGLVNNEITFSSGTDIFTAIIKPEDISNNIATNITPQAIFSSTAPPKITIKFSPLDAASIAKARISLTYTFLSASGKKLLVTLKKINFKKDSPGENLKIEVPSDNISNLDDDLIDVAFIENGYRDDVKIGNDKDQGPISTNGTDTLSFDLSVFKQRFLEKFGLSKTLNGAYGYSIILKGTSIAIDIENGNFKKINSIKGNITFQ